MSAASTAAGRPCPAGTGCCLGMMLCAFPSLGALAAMTGLSCACGAAGCFVSPCAAAVAGRLRAVLLTLAVSALVLSDWVGSTAAGASYLPSWDGGLPPCGGAPLPRPEPPLGKPLTGASGKPCTAPACDAPLLPPFGRLLRYRYAPPAALLERLFCALPLSFGLLAVAARIVRLSL